MTATKRLLNNTEKRKITTLIVIGSGGHTTEMLRIVKHLDFVRFSPRIYVIASSDENSISKVKQLETNDGTYSIHRIPRSRKVHQNYISAIFTTVYSILYSIPIVFSSKPDLILCNGPGTCIPICLSAFIMRILFLSSNIIIYIESICRVKTLSLSGKILLYFADQVIVQWPELHSLYPKTIYIDDVIL